MSLARVNDTVRKTARRLGDVEGIRQRRKFAALRTEFYDGLWRDAATAVGAEYERLDGGFTQIRKGDLATFVDRADLMLDDALTLSVMADKALTFRIFSAKGYRVPQRAEFTLESLKVASDFLEAFPGNVVVKPGTGTGGGRGVTTGISTEKRLAEAARHAAGFNQSLLIEEQLTGASYRLLYINGEYIDAVRRDAPEVIGDGASSISDLIKAENLKRRTGRPLTALSPLIIDKECRNTLAQSRRTPASRAAKDEAVIVKTAVNENAAGQNHNVRSDVHQEIIAAGAKLASDLGVQFAGLDVTAHDISLPLEQANVYFNEINVNPGIHHHYLISDPESGVPVAERALDYMFTSRRGVLVL